MNHSIINEFITSHVLDTSSGLPAAGLKLKLFINANNSDDEALDHWQQLAEVRTGDDGRAIFDFNIVSGVYKIKFYVKEYFQAFGTTCFYPKVEVAFNIIDPSSHYHVPLILSPHGYSTYRGS